MTSLIDEKLEKKKKVYLVFCEICGHRFEDDKEIHEVLLNEPELNIICGNCYLDKHKE